MSFVDEIASTHTIVQSLTRSNRDFFRTLTSHGIGLLENDRFKVYNELWELQYGRKPSDGLTRKLLAQGHDYPHFLIDAPAIEDMGRELNLTRKEKGEMWYAWQKETPEWCSRNVASYNQNVPLERSLSERLASKTDTIRVLEIGCGKGIAVQQLNARERIRAFGVDIAPPQKGIMVDSQKLPFRSDAFDISLCYCMLMYLPRPEMQQVIHEMFRVTAPQGYVFFDTNVIHAQFIHSFLNESYPSTKIEQGTSSVDMWFRK